MMTLKSMTYSYNVQIMHAELHWNSLSTYHQDLIKVFHIQQ